MKSIIATVFAGVSVFALASLYPVSAASVDISGNGNFSNNDVHVNEASATVVRQTNNSDFTNNVSVNNNTGYNSANGNTGGNVSIGTGNANADVSINNTAGMNVAHVMGNNSNPTDIQINGNGAFSDNRVNYTDRNYTLIDQNNQTDINNNVQVSNNTGHNTANGNTGNVPFWNPWYSQNQNGNVQIDTGNANANVSIDNKAGINEAHVMGNTNNNTDIQISGNGAFSHNDVNYNNSNSVPVYQRNDTNFDNNVNVRNNTGYNTTGNTGYWPWSYQQPKQDYYQPEQFSYPKYHTISTPEYRMTDWNRPNNDWMSTYPSFTFGQEYPKYTDGTYANHHSNYGNNKPYIVYSPYVNTNDHKDSYSNQCDNRQQYRPQLQSYYPVLYRPVYYPVMTYNYPKNNYRHQDKDDHYMSNKQYDGNKYGLMNGKEFAYYPFWLSRYPNFYGNTHGNVSIHTGDANASVHLNNLASANFLN